MIVDFLRDNWQYISAGLVVLLDILILIFKRRLKVNYTLPSSWYPDLIDIVSEAEDVFGAGHGSEKLHYVKQRMKARIGLKYNDGVLDFMIGEFVERILNTPTKKGGCGREEA